MYDKLATKSNAIDTKVPIFTKTYVSDKQDLDKKIQDVHKQMPNTNALVKEVD